MTRTLYDQVIARILDGIAAGEFNVGDRLPPESAFARDLGVSRSTLRLAYAELERGGVLRRRKRAGTRIIGTRIQSRFNMVTGGIHEILSLGRDAALNISGTRNVREEEFDILAGLESETGFWLEVSGSRSIGTDQGPFNMTRVYVPGRYSGIAPLMTGTIVSVLDVIEKTFGVEVGRIDQTVRAIACPPDAARVIGLNVGDPALIINARLYDKSDNLLEVSSATFDPARFQIRTDVRVD